VGRVHSYPNEIAIGGCDGIAAAIISPHNDGGSNAVCCSYSFHQNIMKFVVIVCASTSVVPYGTLLGILLLRWIPLATQMSHHIVQVRDISHSHNSRSKQLPFSLPFLDET